MVLFLEAAPPKSSSQDWCLPCHYWATYGLLKWCPKSMNVGQEYAGLDSPARRDGTCAYNYFRWGWHPASVSHSCSLMLGCHASCPVVQWLITYSTPLPSIPCTGISDCNVLVFVDSYWRVMWPEHFIHPLLQSVCGTYRLCGIHRTSLGSVCDI